MLATEPQMQLLGNFAIGLSRQQSKYDEPLNWPQRLESFSKQLDVLAARQATFGIQRGNVNWFVLHLIETACDRT